MSQPVIEFFFEFSSPYSYLAATQLAAICDATGARIELKPMLLGVVFKEIGNALPASIPAKGKYMFGDIKRWARHYDVPFRWPSMFPISAINAKRAVLAARREHGPEVAQALMLHLFRGYWVEGLDLGSTESLEILLQNAEQDLSGLIEKTQEPSIKEELKLITQEAVDRGVFGAPTFFVGEQMFWGNDRIDFLIQACKEA